ncbi:predicted protein [Nematostella vectensis]|uniref:F-box domain-containing protein n=1 Tax=Nematostella vectensis TaxID=45351 RepID=A7RXF7_NEMVE|nr:predicted protein [Nematostella vectensis]|eukprot:XP_001635830.1 predicted protein [Nematostella vectensis]
MDFVDFLPLEVSTIIFSYLDIGSLLNASKTSRKWRRIISGIDIIWKKGCKVLDRVEVEMDIKLGFSWRKIATLNYGKNGVMRRWLKGRYSDISSKDDIPKDILCPLDTESWGRILDKEMNRNQ